MGFYVMFSVRLLRSPAVIPEHVDASVFQKYYQMAVQQRRGTPTLYNILIWPAVIADGVLPNRK